MLSDLQQACIPRNRFGGSKLVLGTAQLSAPYGSVRQTCAPSSSQSVALVRTAIDCGITHIDTAHDYPNSEIRLGKALAGGRADRVQVITKLSTMKEIADDAPAMTVREAVDRSIAESCQRLGLFTLPVLLLHRMSHLRAWNGIVWRRLLKLQKDGQIGMLGVSVQSVDEAMAALAIPEIQYIQLACNILDTRWDDAGIPARAVARPDVVLHARSALLQGVLLARDTDSWPRIDGLDVSTLSGWLAETAENMGRRNVADLCYAWLRSQSWIDAIVVGMESEEQVRDNVALFATPDLDCSALAKIARTRPAFPAILLSPALWPENA